MSRPPVEIIAEVANAHQGNADAAIEIARRALEAGADAVKFQVYSAEELLVRSHPRYQHFKEQAFGEATWERILHRLKEKNSRVYCDVFGLDSLRVARRAGVDGYKLHSSDLSNTHLLNALARENSTVFLGAGGSSAREIVRALHVLGSRRTREQLVLLYGFQSYPTAVEDSGLERLRWLNAQFGDHCRIGYADHVAGDHTFSTTLPLMAIGMGAAVLEKHVTLDRSAKGVDYYSSLEPGEFGEFVRAVRAGEQALGIEPESFVPAEREYRTQVKKHWVGARALKSGHVIEPTDLVMKRVEGMAAEPVELEKLVGHKLLHHVDEEQPVTRSDVAQTVWALVVVRMASSRLPCKAMADVDGMPAIAHLLGRLNQCGRVDKTVLCTTTEAEDDPLAALAEQSGTACYRGPVEDVLGRMVGALEGHAVDLALRVTGDDILVDPEYVDRAVEHHLRVGAEYTDLKRLPSGTEVEVFDADLLGGIWKAARNPKGTEYLTTYVVDHRDHFRTTSAPVEERHARDWRLTLDTPEDYQVIQALLAAMREQGKALTYRLDDMVRFFEANPEVLKINSRTRQRGTPIEVDTTLNWMRMS